MLAYKTLRDKFEEYKRKKGINALTIEALRWFRTYTSKYVKNASFRKTVDFGVFTTKPIPGKFFLYHYDPKTKEKLPYYDILPLVLITKVTPDGWYGINFHYMPPSIRLKIMEGFYNTIKSNKYSSNFKLKANWKRAVAIANAVSTNEYLKHSIKRYLRNHIASPLVELDPNYWTMCLFLPLSRFKIKSSGYVWKDI